MAEKEERWSELNCRGCGRHQVIEDNMNLLGEQNEQEHSEIMQKLDMAVANIHWMSIIGKWILGTMVGYFIALAIFIFNGTATENHRIDAVTERVSYGESQHKMNEGNIKEIKGSLEIIKDILIKSKDNR